MTFFRLASQINEFSFICIAHGFEVIIQGPEHIVFSLVHVAKLLHQFAENVLVSENAPLRDFDFVRESFAGLLQGFNSGEDGINLEGEAPSVRLLIVFFEQIDALATQVLPLADRFLDPLGLRKAFLQ